jgi:hypothetical protein
VRSVTYHLVNIPAPVLAFLLRLGDALVHPEVPIKMHRLPSLALVVVGEPSTALCAWLA